VTGHLLSALAWAYAGTGTTEGDQDRRALQAKGDYLVAQLASLQARAPRAGYSDGYLSAFPEQSFTWLEDGQWKRIWSPYYIIHKILAGLIDQYQLAGNTLALDVASRLADWVDRRTRNLSYQHMQTILQVEFGGLPEALANLYAITGDRATLKTAERFYHARFLDPLAANTDVLNGAQCNVSTPKVIAALRLAEETGNEKYWNAAVNFWRIVTAHHSYAIGGQGNYEHWGPPDVVAGALSNYNCEGCVSYNMLKLTRLLHFHEPGNAAYLDYYERTLVNHLLGTQDPGSRTAWSPTTRACRQARTSRSRRTTSPASTRTSSRPTTTRSPAIPRPAWRHRPASPTRSTPETPMAPSASTSSSPRGSAPMA